MAGPCYQRRLVALRQLGPHLVGGGREEAALARQYGGGHLELAVLLEPRLELPLVLVVCAVGIEGAAHGAE
jgi:hypothetical protein